MIRHLIAVLLVCICTPMALYAQDGRYDSITLGPRGPVAGASIAVCTQPATTTTTPCSPLASLFTSSTGATAAPNPLLADTFGNFHFYAAPGLYTVQIYGPGISPPTVLRDQLVLQSTSGSVTSVSAGPLAPLFTTTVTNPTSTPAISFTLDTAASNTVFGNCTSGTATPTFCAITATMLPFPTASSIGGIESITCPTGPPLQFITSISGLGVPTCGAPTSTGIGQAETVHTTSLCTPPSGSSFDACGFTITWPVAFADTAYVASCTLTEPAANGGDPATNDTNAFFINVKSTGSMTGIIQNLRGAQNTPTAIDCIGIHP